MQVKFKGADWKIIASRVYKNDIFFMLENGNSVRTDWVSFEQIQPTQAEGLKL